MTADTTPYAQLDRWIDEHFDEQVRLLQELVRVVAELTRPPSAREASCV